jgi:hypothetical protein
LRALGFTARFGICRAPFELLASHLLCTKIVFGLKEIVGAAINGDVLERRPAAARHWDDVLELEP